MTKLGNLNARAFITFLAIQYKNFKSYIQTEYLIVC